MSEDKFWKQLRKRVEEIKKQRWFQLWLLWTGDVRDE